MSKQGEDGSALNNDTAQEARIKKEFNMATELVKCTASKIVSKDAQGNTIERKLDTPLELSVAFDFGDNLADAVAKHTEAQVFALYKSKGVIAVQDAGRRLLMSGKTPEAVLAAMKDFKFGATIKVPVDPKQAAIQAMGGMTPEEKKAFIAELAKLAKGE